MYNKSVTSFLPSFLFPTSLCKTMLTRDHVHGHTLLPAPSFFCGACNTPHTAALSSAVFFVFLIYGYVQELLFTTGLKPYVHPCSAEPHPSTTHMLIALGGALLLDYPCDVLPFLLPFPFLLTRTCTYTGACFGMLLISGTGGSSPLCSLSYTA